MSAAPLLCGLRVIDAASYIAGLVARTTLADLGADPRAGAALTVASPLAIEGVETIPPRFPPALGEHSVEILCEVGYADAQIEVLLGAAVVVQPK